MSLLKKLFGASKKLSGEYLAESKNFCVMPWVHFHVTQQGTVTPCCQAPWQEEKSFGNINRQGIKEIWTGEQMNAFRKQMLEDKQDERCKGCFVKEASGFTSLRQITNAKYLHKKEALVLSTAKNGATMAPQPVYFDIRFSNICNLKCRICGPWSSSNWFNDAVKLGMIKENSAPITRSFGSTTGFFKEFDEMTDLLEEIYFAGGEPLVSDEHYEILELLIRKGKTDVKLTYNTNFSSLQYKQHNLVSLWKHFPDISIAASLDASGERGEFLRKNLHWKSVVENRKKLMKELPHIEFVVSPTLNIYNLLHLPHFHKEWVGEGLILVEDFIPTLLVTPVELSVHILPGDFKRKASALYKEHLLWIRSKASVHEPKRVHMLSQFENILTCLETAKSEVSLDAFRKSSKEMDAVRTEQTILIFPELKELF